jgi:phosphohistidine phosphatase
MPKRLVLLRHAKSGWSDTELRDFDRPLSNRGMRDAPRMGQLLLQKGIQPDLIISSDAVRALTTAKLVAQELGYPVANILTSHALYLAPPNVLLDAVSNASSDCETVLLVAHNPGMTELANRLSDAHIDNLPTCGVFMVETTLPDWASFETGGGSFAGFLSPKQDLG